VAFLFVLAGILSSCGKNDPLDIRGQSAGDGQIPLDPSGNPGAPASPTPTSNEAKDKNPGVPSSSSSRPSGGDEAAASIEKSEKVLALLVLGGYTSCDDPKTPLDQAMTEIGGFLNANVKAETDETKLLFMSCYGVDPNQINFSWDHDPKQGFARSIEEMAKFINTSLKSPKSVRIGLVGHSYGGWTAMKLAPLLDPKFKLEVMVTLDPISKVECTPQGFIDVLVSGAPQPGCLRAPRDISQAVIDKIKPEKPWVNYYQTDFNLLHSSPINQVKNVKKSYTGPGFEPHLGFITDADLFQEIWELF
jgi:hypothetical protein